MNKIGKIILLGLALALLVPSACAIQVGLAGSSNGVGFTDGMTLTGTKDASLAVQNTVSGGTLSQTVTGGGRLDLHKTFTADDNAGEIAKIIVDVTKAGTLNYVQPAITTTSTSAALTGFTLTATDAAEIDCTSKAINRFGDKAVSSIGIQQGSLNNYGSWAGADTNGVRTNQGLDSANGNSIDIEETATTRLGDKAVSSIDVQQGSLNNYGSWTSANPTVGFVSTQVYGMNIGANGNLINIENKATNTFGDKTISSMNVLHGSLNNYGSFAGGYPYKATTGQDFDIANGNSIDIEERASNELGNARTSTMISQGTISGYGTGEYRHGYNDAVHGSYLLTGRRIIGGFFMLPSPGIVSGRSIELQSIANNADGAVSSSDTIAKNAVVNGYESRSGVYTGDVESLASQRSDTISGSNIQLLAKSLEKGGDKSSIYTEVQSGSNEGLVSGYRDYTSASPLSYSEYTGYELVGAITSDFTASGDKIHLDATTIDNAGNKATAITEVLKGTIWVTNNADVIVSPNELIEASQFSNGVTGNKLTLDATSKNAAKVKATNRQQAVNPNSDFHNAAYVTTGIPTLYQGIP